MIYAALFTVTLVRGMQASACCSWRMYSFFAAIKVLPIPLRQVASPRKAAYWLYREAALR